MTVTVAQAVLWVCLLLLAYTYFLYPCFLFLAYAASQIHRDLNYLNGRRDRRRSSIGDGELPAVSLIVPAYNEERHLPKKIDNIRRLDYPKDKLEVIFVSDGSTDRTNEILRSSANYTTVFLPERKGKPTAINQGVARAHGDVLIHSDASTLFASDSVKKLIRHFRDPKVGVVCGALQFSGSAEHEQTEGVYWKYESALRLMEARLGATLTASGAIYAIRREVQPELDPNVVIEDFVIPMHARKLGYRVVYDPEATAIDFAADTVKDEYTRRVRIALGSFKALRDFLRVPLPALTYWAFFSHKLLRWAIPFLMIGLLATNAILIGSPFYRILFLAQLLFYLWAGMGYLLRHRIRGVQYAKIAYFLLAIHFAYLVGFFHFLTGRGEVKWQRVP